MASWIIEFISATGYLGIIFLMFLESLFPPIPSELIMPLASHLAADGKFNMFLTVLAGTLGSVLGTIPLYFAGRLFGEKRLRAFADRHGRWITLSQQDIDRGFKWFQVHGNVAVLFCRVVPGIRSLISIPAGITEMNLMVFLIFTTIGTAVWVGLLSFLGYILGENFSNVGDYIDPVSTVIFIVIGVLYIYRVIIHKTSQ